MSDKPKGRGAAPGPPHRRPRGDDRPILPFRLDGSIPPGAPGWSSQIAELSAALGSLQAAYDALDAARAGRVA